LSRRGNCLREQIEGFRNCGDARIGECDRQRFELRRKWYRLEDKLNDLGRGLRERGDNVDQRGQFDIGRNRPHRVYGSDFDGRQILWRHGHRGDSEDTRAHDRDAGGHIWT
jgi:hypothetical protein